jgi:protein-S-isoprenylcysteine O-methyltransferase Ste14
VAQGRALFASFASLGNIARSAAVNSTEAGAGLILRLAGCAFAVWARLHLGQKLGNADDLQGGHDLVTGGSYRYIRHPNLQRNAAGHLRIGSRRRPGLPGGFVGMAIYCVYSARTEEVLMMQAFLSNMPGTSGAPRPSSRLSFKAARCLSPRARGSPLGEVPHDYPR